MPLVHAIVASNTSVAVVGDLVEAPSNLGVHMHRSARRDCHGANQCSELQPSPSNLTCRPQTVVRRRLFQAVIDYVQARALSSEATMPRLQTGIALAKQLFSHYRTALTSRKSREWL